MPIKESNDAFNGFKLHLMGQFMLLVGYFDPFNPRTHRLFPSPQTHGGQKNTTPPTSISILLITDWQI